MKHALIIEDQILIALMIQDQLLESGFESADIAASENEAIRLAEARCPDLITADDQLEQGSGIGAIRHICRDRAIPVVFVTADAERVEMTLGEAPLLLKPFSTAALVSAITAAVPAAKVYA